MIIVAAPGYAGTGERHLQIYGGKDLDDQWMVRSIYRTAQLIPESRNLRRFIRWIHYTDGQVTSPGTFAAGAALRSVTTGSL